MIGVFDRYGFLRHQKSFQPDDIPEDLSSRRYLITGANSGIGFATAAALAKRGAEVWLLCRDRARGEEALGRLRAEYPAAKLFLEQIDLCSFASIRDFVARFPAGEITGLAHNAGLLPAARQLSADGFELTFAAHVLGPQLLTRLLLPKLDGTRVVFVSSGGMYTRKLNLDDLDWSRRRYDGVVAYADTKRMQVILSELWPSHAPRTLFYSMHPGWAETPAVQSSIPTFYRVTKAILRTPEQGADTLVWLLAGPRQESGTFWFDRARRSTHYLPWTKERPESRASLWELVERSIPR